AAGGILGGLGALILGTKTGRGVATSAAKLGGLALIAGLAYKAYQNHQEGKPLITSRRDAPEVPPSGSGYEVQTLTSNDAQLYVRAMISGAASDGHIDESERQAIMGGIRSAGMTEDAASFLEDEFSWPATPQDLADAVNSPEQAAQVYTAARMTIDADNHAERDYLTQLANMLDLNPDLAAHIDAEVQGVRV
ncbi:MAG: tellurite resistance TerB family protein, partial [Hyphomicrobiaceae bacterium]